MNIGGGEVSDTHTSVTADTLNEKKLEALPKSRSSSYAQSRDAIPTARTVEKGGQGSGKEDSYGKLNMARGRGSVVDVHGQDNSAAMLARASQLMGLKVPVLGTSMSKMRPPPGSNGPGGQWQ